MTIKLYRLIPNVSGNLVEILQKMEIVRRKPEQGRLLGLVKICCEPGVVTSSGK